MAELFVGSGSTADLFPILTVLLREAPFRRLALVAATIVMVSVSPLASEANVTVCGFSNRTVVANASAGGRAGNQQGSGRQIVDDRCGRCIRAIVGNGNRVSNVRSRFHRCRGRGFREREVSAGAAARGIGRQTLNFSRPVNRNIAEAFQSAGSVNAENGNSKVLVRRIQKCARRRQ